MKRYSKPLTHLGKDAQGRRRYYIARMMGKSKYTKYYTRLVIRDMTPRGFDFDERYVTFEIMLSDAKGDEFDEL